MTISESQIREIKNDIEGTCKTLAEIVESYDLDASEMDLEDRLLDVNTEMCPDCGWWHESGMLSEYKETGRYVCDQCLEE